jgi:phospholipase/carboxylesterase
VSVVAALFVAARVPSRQTRIRVIEVGDGRWPLILLHGYGSSAREWLPFTQTIRLPPDVRFVFPEATERADPAQPIERRGWWRLDLGSYRPPGPDLSGSSPKGLDESAERIRSFLKDLRQIRTASSAPMLGGFSQGAMIAADIAFRSDEPISALVILSGTIVHQTAWTDGMRARKGLPVFMAHGTRDPILEFETAARFERLLREAGLAVTWVPFEGGHEIPSQVVASLNGFLAGIPATIPGHGRTSSSSHTRASRR